MENGKFELPQGFEPYKKDIQELCVQIAKAKIHDGNSKITLKLNKDLYESEAFKNLWERIKYKTTYRVNFDSEMLVKNCIRDLQDNLSIGKNKIQSTQANIQTTQAGHSAIKPKTRTIKTIDNPDQTLPDLLKRLQNNTDLTRASLINILTKSGKLQDFTNDPERFIAEAITIIKKTINGFVVEGISYTKDGEFCRQDIFKEEEIDIYPDQSYEHISTVNNALYTHTLVDSKIERAFAQDCDHNEDIALYTKLPKVFKIQTPLGTYNPDWAMVYNSNGNGRLYFVIETKGSSSKQDIKASESGKITCAIKHFEHLEVDIEVRQTHNLEAFLGSF